MIFYRKMNKNNSNSTKNCRTRCEKSQNLFFQEMQKIHLNNSLALKNKKIKNNSK